MTDMPRGGAAAGRRPVATGRRAAPALRRQFELRPDVVFLNHGSFGACPRPVLGACQAWQREMEQEPVDFLARRGARLLAEARARLAEHVGCAADDLVYLPNATHGVNVVAHSLTVSRTAALQPGDEVVGTDHEYGACARAWRLACAVSGASYVPAQVPVPVSSAEEVVERVWSAVTPRTRVLFLSHITSPTALVFPVEELCRRARSAGIWSVVDGAHGPGQLPLDLELSGADFYAGNCHKWLCAPKGSGFLYARREVQRFLEPLVTSWGTQPENPGPSRFVDDLEFAGTRDVAAFLAVPAAIDFLARHQWDAVRAHCHELAREARRRLLSRPGTWALHDDDPRLYAQMVAVVLPPCDPVALHSRLFHGHGVEVPCYWWRGRPLLRVSVQGYNGPADLDALDAALDVELAAG
jgi:isopenicillin-N epimerase